MEFSHKIVAAVLRSQLPALEEWALAIMNTGRHADAIDGLLMLISRAEAKVQNLQANARKARVAHKAKADARRSPMIPPTYKPSGKVAPGAKHYTTADAGTAMVYVDTDGCVHTRNPRLHE